MSGAVEGADQAEAKMAMIAKAIKDFDALLGLLRSELRVTKPWQRQLAGRLAELDHLLQVLRLTIIMERSDVEVSDAADALLAACRATSGALAGSRADHVTRTALRLTIAAAELLVNSLSELRHGPAFAFKTG